jgi:hypothetical protein
LGTTHAPIGDREVFGSKFGNSVGFQRAFGN